MRNEHLKVKNTRLYYALLDIYESDSEHLWDDLVKEMSDDEINMILRRLVVRLEEKELLVDEVD